jgi:HD-GYP domain-containing protein (c-di-GMP phosphodiesterase class II)
MDNEPLYNSRIIDNYIRLIQKKYDNIDINELLCYSGMQHYEIADQGHWFSQLQIDRFHEKLSQLTNNKNIAREAGRFAAAPEANGVMRQWVLGMVGPSNAYAMIGKGSANFTRSARFASKKLAPNKVEITVTPRAGVREKPFQCQNRIGYLEAITGAFNGKLSNLEHPECVFDGGKCCRYIITWEKSLCDFLKKVRNFAAILMTTGCLFFAFGHPMLTLTTIVPAAAALLFLIMFMVGNIEKRELKKSLNLLQFSTDQLVEQININYNNALLTNDVGQAISRQASHRDVLQNVIQIFQKRLDYDRCMILLADKEKKHLFFRAGYGYSKEQLKLLQRTSFHLDRHDSKGVFVVAFRQQQSFLINDIREIKADLSLRSLIIADKLGSQAFMCCPIVCDGESIGILAVDNLRTKKELVQSDMSLLTGIASILGISIRNAALLAASDQQFRSILHVLSASIDARDPMTSGHSAKVTEYAMGISDELGLPVDYCEVVRFAALLHDYGKIGIPDTILKKPGRLTDDEYEIVKTHADKTRQILGQIKFEGIYSLVPDIAGSHHEKLDGSGYPNGLKGDMIPLGSRIVAVADFFEAITAERHYRGPMSVEKAFELLHFQSGKRFDSEVVGAFFRYYTGLGFEESTHLTDAMLGINQVSARSKRLMVYR